MQLSPANFNRHLNSIGQQFIWRKAYGCPCVDPNTGGALPSCQHCFGKGRIWDADVTPGVAGIVGRNNFKKYADFGVFDPSDTMLSIPSDSPLYSIGQFDRVSAVNRTEPFDINLIYGVNDKIQYTVVSIDRISWIGANGALVIGQIPTISDNGVIQWDSANTPPEMASYSVSGRWHPEYFVYIDLPFDRPFHHGAALPRRVVLRRFDLFGR